MTGCYVFKKSKAVQPLIFVFIFLCSPIVIISDDRVPNPSNPDIQEPENQLVQTMYASPVVQSLQSITVTNPIGVAAAVTMLATMLILDNLASKGLIDSKWSYAQCKEKIFGITIYDGDQYYKNWRHPKNIERKFPTIPRYEYSLDERYAYEKEMSAAVHQIQDVVQCQTSLQQLTWPHPSCEKLLQYKLSPDYVFISENEELQLDERLTQELANCRNSAVRNMKEGRSKIYFIFEKLGNEIVHQLKKIVEDLKDFKIDPKLAIILSCLGVGIFEAISESESDSGDNSDDDSGSYEQFFVGMHKKDIIKLFTNCSDYYALLQDFEQSLDLNDNFFMQYRSQIQHFTNNEKQSVASMVKTLQEKITLKKELAQRCLKKIEAYCKETNQSKIIPNLTKSLKKSAISRQKNRNKKIDERLRLNAPVTINVQDLLSFDPLVDFLDNHLS